ncbi:DUF3368 domain-containing protein [Nostoc sp. MS1]|uniref:DUF3368 domain-containing protein n=1 Tax=Nostoc sp. MS1 TaxID=2764711 RepID=UPI00398C4D5A
MRVTGVLGILLAAKKQGFVPLVKPILDDLIELIMVFGFVNSYVLKCYCWLENSDRYSHNGS